MESINDACVMGILTLQQGGCTLHRSTILQCLRSVSWIGVNWSPNRRGFGIIVLVHFLWRILCGRCTIWFTMYCRPLPTTLHYMYVRLSYQHRQSKLLSWSGYSNQLSMSNCGCGSYIRKTGYCIWSRPSVCPYWFTLCTLVQSTLRIKAHLTLLSLETV